MIRCTFKSCFSSRTVFAGEYRKLKGNYLPHLIKKRSGHENSVREIFTVAYEFSSLKCMNTL